MPFFSAEAVTTVNTYDIIDWDGLSSNIIERLLSAAASEGSMTISPFGGMDSVSHRFGADYIRICMRDRDNAVTGMTSRKALG